ncbi:ECF-type riboflavin transporter substrate-binding protein, partial [Streptococcus suis]
YHEASNKVYAQGFLSAGVNSLTIAIGGSLLLAAYAKSRTKAGSLSKE